MSNRNVLSNQTPEVGGWNKFIKTKITNPAQKSKRTVCDTKVKRVLDNSLKRMDVVGSTLLDFSRKKCCVTV